MQPKVVWDNLEPPGTARYSCFTPDGLATSLAAPCGCFSPHDTLSRLISCTACSKSGGVKKVVVVVVADLLPLFFVCRQPQENCSLHGSGPKTFDRQTGGFHRA